MSIYDMLKKINLGRSTRFMDNTRRPYQYYSLPSGFGGASDAPYLRQFTNSSSSPSFLSGIWDRLKTRSADYFSDPDNLMKLGIGGIGGLAGYFHAKEAEKRAKQMDKFRMQMAQRQQARYDAAEAERAKYNQPRVYQNPRQRVGTPVTLPTGETIFFDENQLSGEQANENVKSIFAAAGGPIGYVAGGTAGQADKIPAMLSDGEFVFDAETVSMLGDGNNAAGASALEQMRENIRRQKRAAPANKIPPKAKKPEAYMKKGK